MTQQTSYIFFIISCIKNRLDKFKNTTFSRNIVMKNELFIGQNVITQ